MDWLVIDSGKKLAYENMAKDANLLLNLGAPTLHLYDWEKDAATYGHFIDPKKFFKLETIELAKRPTGGGIVFHIADFAFSVLIPASHPAFSINPLENYLFINRQVSSIIETMFGEKIDLLPEEDSLREAFCMAKPTKYDLMLHGRKVGGAAQRKTKQGYLHQGSILLGQLKDDFLEKILLDETLIEKMKDNSLPLLGNDWTKSQLIDARQQLKVLFKKVFANSFDF